MYSRQDRNPRGSDGYSRGRTSERYESYENKYGSYNVQNPVSLAESQVKKTYWSGEATRFKTIENKTLDTIIVGHLTMEQTNAYQQFFRVEEISDILRTAHQKRKDLLSLIPSGDAKNVSLKREPSPPPKYDNSGNRVNTREIRVREALEKERDLLVELAASSIKDYHPPYDYQKPQKTMEKLYIPIKDYPDINFVGFLLGPRGNTLRKLQEDSGAKLAIRGKGSVKDGKSTNSRLLTDSTTNADATEDDLHVVITADSQHKIAKAIQLTNEIIEKLISSPVHQNDLKREQLRELAVLNGTLRETKPFDPNRLKEQSKSNFDITKIVCKVCGKMGHFARDCKFKDQPPQQELPHYEQEEVPPWKKQKVEAPTVAPFTAVSTSETSYPPPSIATAPPPSVTMAPPPVISAPPPSIPTKPPPPSVQVPPPSSTKPPPPVQKPPPPSKPPQPPQPTQKPPPPAKPAPPVQKPPPPP